MTSLVVTNSCKLKLLAASHSDLCPRWSWPSSPCTRGVFFNQLAQLLHNLQDICTGVQKFICNAFCWFNSVMEKLINCSYCVLVLSYLVGGSGGCSLVLFCSMLLLPDAGLDLCTLWLWCFLSRNWYKHSTCTCAGITCCGVALQPLVQKLHLRTHLQLVLCGVM